ncbi:hypothetical protein ACLI4Z_03430 [Natrialbaceae archaeon A-arb3/5]
MVTGTIGKLGLVFLLLGAVLLAAPVYGFSSVITDRGVQIGTAADADAYLGVESASDATLDGPGDETELATLTNNMGDDIHTIEMNVEFVDAGDALTAETPETIAAGETEPILVSCDGHQGGPPGSDTTSVEIDVEYAGADRMTVEGVAVTTTLTYDCHSDGGDGPPHDSEADVVVSAGDSHDGDIQTDGSVLTEWTAVIDGDVTAGGWVQTGDESLINGDVQAGGDVTTGWSSVIEGNVDSEGDVSTGDSSKIGGDVTTGGDLTTGWDSTIDGDVNAGGSVTMADSTEIDGDVTAGGGLTTGWGSTINGDVTTGGDVTVGDSTIDGDLYSEGDIVLEWGATVTGDVHADGDVVINHGATVNGDVSAGGTVHDER